MGPVDTCPWGETHPSWQTKADHPAQQLQVHGNAYLCHNSRNAPLDECPLGSDATDPGLEAMQHCHAEPEAQEEDCAD
ncbi:UNVERIFIED_CONTAM: hypothetical protein K2H54_049363 [Gekko kuhli]